MSQNKRHKGTEEDTILTFGSHKHENMGAPSTSPSPTEDGQTSQGVFSAELALSSPPRSRSTSCRAQVHKLGVQLGQCSVLPGGGDLPCVSWQLSTCTLKKKKVCLFPGTKWFPQSSLLRKMTDFQQNKTKQNNLWAFKGYLWIVRSCLRCRQSLFIQTRTDWEPVPCQALLEAGLHRWKHVVSEERVRSVPAC